MSWNPVSVHKKYETTGRKHLFGPRFALSSPEPVKFFASQFSLGGGVQFSFGGGTSSHLGGHGPGMPPVAPGLISTINKHN